MESEYSATWFRCALNNPSLRMHLDMPSFSPVFNSGKVGACCNGRTQLHCVASVQGFHASGHGQNRGDMVPPGGRRHGGGGQGAAGAGQAAQPRDAHPPGQGVGIVMPPARRWVPATMPCAACRAWSLSVAAGHVIMLSFGLIDAEPPKFICTSEVLIRNRHPLVAAGKAGAAGVGADESAGRKARRRAGTGPAGIRCRPGTRHGARLWAHLHLPGASQEHTNIYSRSQNELTCICVRRLLLLSSAWQPVRFDPKAPSTPCQAVPDDQTRERRTPSHPQPAHQLLLHDVMSCCLTCYITALLGAAGPAARWGKIGCSD